MLVGDIKFEPEMIEVAGPKEEIALINHVQTLEDTIDNISTTYNKK